MSTNARASIAAATLMMGVPAMHAAAAEATFGPSNPFYAPSSLPFQAPPFDKIKDADYQQAMLAGMAQQQAEIRAIAESPSQPTFENTIIPLEKSGLLLERASEAFTQRGEYQPDAAGGKGRVGA